MMFIDMNVEIVNCSDNNDNANSSKSNNRSHAVHVS
jgi:hypothetical protein